MQATREPPKGTFTSLLSIDLDNLRNIISSIVLVEVEQSIKRYLLIHPEHLPEDAGIVTAEDFDVELADYFDVMSGSGGGGWVTMYLASRGGQGFSKSVLQNPDIIKKYGVISPGSASGLIAFFKEYTTVIYSPRDYNLSAGAPLDLTNPFSTGVLTTVYDHEGIETAMETFIGNATLNDLDTTVFVPTFDLFRVHS